MENPARPVSRLCLAAGVLSFLSFLLIGHVLILASPVIGATPIGDLLPQDGGQAGNVRIQIEAHLQPLPFLLSSLDDRILGGRLRISYFLPFYMYIVSSLMVVFSLRSRNEDPDQNRAKRGLAACIFYFLPSFPTFLDGFTVWIPLLVSAFNISILALRSYSTDRAEPVFGPWKQFAILVILFASLGIGFPAIFIWISLVFYLLISGRTKSSLAFLLIFLATMYIYFSVYQFPASNHDLGFSQDLVSSFFVYFLEFLFKPVIVVLTSAKVVSAETPTGYIVLAGVAAGLFAFFRFSSRRSAVLPSVTQDPRFRLHAYGTGFYLLWIAAAAAYHVVDEPRVVHSRFWLPITSLWFFALCGPSQFTGRVRTAALFAASIPALAIVSLLHWAWTARWLLDAPGVR